MVLEWAKKQEEILKDHFAQGHLVDDVEHKFVVRHAGAIGECQMARRIINLDFDKLVEDLANE